METINIIVNGKSEAFQNGLKNKSKKSLKILELHALLPIELTEIWDYQMYENKRKMI